MEKVKPLILATLCIIYIYIPAVVFADVYLNFDDFPVTGENEVPGNSRKGWRYSSPHTNPVDRISNCGWYNINRYPNNPSVFDYFAYYRCYYNNAHMGFETFGFLEIDGQTSVRGNSLKITVTGGHKGEKDKDVHGMPLYNKETYLSYLKKSQNPAAKDGVKVGHPYIYFQNSSPSDSSLPFQEAKGCNRLSLYVKMPPEVCNDGSPPHSPQPSTTMNIGTFNNVGGHWYHHIYNRGGGWTHILLDSHPQHNNAFHNASCYPYPSYSLRDMGTDYFGSLYRFYITFSPYSGIATPPYNVWIDEIEYYYDPEPQNNETISSPAVTFHADNNLFEIGFNDKYKNNQSSWSTYEVRYSFSQINNNNYKNAKLVIIQDDPRFKVIKYNKNGCFKKVWPYYQSTWAPFKIQKQDESELKPGTTIYFAVKDMSDRPYNTGGFDEEGDTEIVPGTGGKRRIDLIKRIDYFIAEK